MNLTTLGDLSHSFALRQRQFDLKTESQKLQMELTTGLAADTRSHLQGDYAHLNDIERSLKMLESYRFAITESDTTTLAMQSSLGVIQDVTVELSSALFLAAQPGGQQGLKSASAQAEQSFATIVGQLNTNAANRSLFAGASFDTSALAPASELMSGLRAAVAGETTLTGVQSALDAWFDTPGGDFETLGYVGSTVDGTPLQLSEDVRVGLSIRADDPIFRESLKSVAMAALAGDQTLGFSQDLQVVMVNQAGSALLELQPELTDTIAGLGLVQSQIEQSRTRNESAALALEVSRNALLSVDPFESATRLEQVQTQIETLYAVTVRASRLTMLDFMR